jgi:hypothetical protein
VQPEAGIAPLARKQYVPPLSGLIFGVVVAFKMPLPLLSKAPELAMFIFVTSMSFLFFL